MSTYYVKKYVAKDDSVGDLSSKILTNQSPNDPPPYDLRKRVKKSYKESSDDEELEASIVDIPKNKPHKTNGPKVYTAAPVKRRTPKSNNLKAASKLRIHKRKRETSTKDVDTAKMDQPSLGQKRPRSDEPVYHIEWEGYEKEFGVSGQKCMICDMDLTISPSGNDDESLENEDDEYQYKPRLLPAIDILSCGHVFHTKCSTDIIADQQSTDPECIFCMSMP